MDFDTCPTEELAEAIGRLHALSCAVQRQLLAAVAAFDRREAWRADGATSMAAWLAWRVGVTQRTGAQWSRVGGALEELPALAEAFASGRLSADQVTPLTRVATADTDAALAEEATEWTAAQCATYARRALREGCVDEAEVRRRRALHWWFDYEAGMLRLSGQLSAEEGATVVEAIERIADAAKPDPETGELEPYPARAADALVELASASMGTSGDPDRATVVIHADAAALVGGEGVAEVEGGPQLSTEALRRRACDARVEWVVHDGDGRTVGVGRARRVVPAWLSRQLRLRDGGCRFPACERRRWGHAHHRLHWADGGPTDLDNLMWLCPAHHRLVHDGGWSIEGDLDAPLTFVRPDGRRVTGGTPPDRNRAAQPGSDRYARAHAPPTTLTPASA